MKALLSTLPLALCTLITLNAPATTRYVDVNSPGAASPFLDWSTAATNIQDAVDIALAGDEIVVTNGLYATGGRAVIGTMTNRVAVDKVLTLRSVNGPAYTFIQGYQVPVTTYGNGAIRCVYLTNGASLSGFTLTNGTTQPGESGGGVVCGSATAVISNCVLAGNSAGYTGGGAFGGTLNNCTIISNSSPGRPGGGGASYATLNNCTMIGNVAVGGGGASHATLNNCMVIGNSASTSGGGGYFSTLNNCTVIGNSASSFSWSRGGGTSDCALNNCILYYNLAPSYSNSDRFDQLNYCCTPDAGGSGNITNAPLFVDQPGGNLHLQTNSPCINAGKNAYASLGSDLDGNPRVVGGTVDIGAYEFQSPASMLSYAWAQQNGLPTDGSADYTDADGDGANNWQEWRADTIPTNTLSVLLLVNATNGPTGATVTWQSVATRNYWLERATNLGAASPFQLISNNIAGAAGTKTVTDASATNAGPYFYRVGVQ